LNQDITLPATRLFQQNRPDADIRSAEKETAESDDGRAFVNNPVGHLFFVTWNPTDKRPIYGSYCGIMSGQRQHIGERSMFKIGGQFCFTLWISVMAFCPLLSARADFFDNARQTFQKDIPHFFQSDVPHFFQDDIPCAFGGQPTSHTRTSCKSRQNSARQETVGNPADAPTQRDGSRPNQDPPVYDH
jgi:hypothetical protein